ncbi:MAG: GNAT family N-acetyltransferase [Oscillospiraceae bacterium]|jgi:RimJ/RimL family protein N-acetyltransferase|nr:GNAT family N-acetyltransferase [Oscillospiraceae bacterium]
MKYFKKLVGERVYLSPIDPDDAEIYTKWVNDAETTQFLAFHHTLFSLGAERAALEQLANSGYNFAIIRAEDDALIGGITLNNIDLVYRKGMLGIYIGEPENCSKGYGAEAISLLLGFGFDTLGLHNIGLQAHSDNARALRCYEKVGFREFGRRREAVFKNGRFYDEVNMDILADEWRAANGR